MIGRFEQLGLTATEQVEEFVNRWYIAGWDNGAMWVQPTRDVLRLTEFCSLLKRIQRLFRSRYFKVAVFHFDQIETHPDHWEFVLRVLKEFAKTTKARCRIVQYDPRKGAHAVDAAEREESYSSPKTSRHPPIRLKGISVVIE